MYMYVHVVINELHYLSFKVVCVWDLVPSSNAHVHMYLHVYTHLSVLVKITECECVVYYIGCSDVM